jgi:hypothetical protein
VISNFQCPAKLRRSEAGHVLLWGGKLDLPSVAGSAGGPGCLTCVSQSGRDSPSPSTKTPAPSESRRDEAKCVGVLSAPSVSGRGTVFSPGAICAVANCVGVPCVPRSSEGAQRDACFWLVIGDPHPEPVVSNGLACTSTRKKAPVPAFRGSTSSPPLQRYLINTIVLVVVRPSTFIRET